MPEPRNDALQGDGEAQPANPLRLVSRFVPAARRRRIASALAAGRLQRIDAVDLLAEESLRSLAPASLYLLLGGGLAFALLNLAARTVQQSGPLLGSGPAVVRAVVLVGANLAAYALMLPLHEALHGATILALGGRPRFGLKLPFAAYCTAPGQIFSRNGYLAIALAPLVVLSAAGAAVTWLAPDLGACIVFGLAGNVSGAVGDLASTVRLRRLPGETLITDTDTGYIAYAIQQS